MFEDRSTRKGFMEKVMGLVLLQLLVTVGASALFRYWDPLLVRCNHTFRCCRGLCRVCESATHGITGRDTGPRTVMSEVL